MFATKQEAEHWAAEQERTIRMTGLPLTIEELKKVTVADIVKRYMKEKTPKKGCAPNEMTVLNKFLKNALCSKALAYVTKQDGHDYYKERLNEKWKGKPIQPSTIRRELNSIQHVFVVAKEQWGYPQLINPFEGIEIERSSPPGRKRGLKDGELEKLEEACNAAVGQNKTYLRLGIYLALATAMRLDEIFNLAWGDFVGRTINIRKSKTDSKTGKKGRVIACPLAVHYILGDLARELHSYNPTGMYEPNTLLFPMTKEAFKQAWRKTVSRAGIDGLQFRDLRSEAATRFEKAGLTFGQTQRMLGHEGNTVAEKHYLKIDLKEIADKLDMFHFGKPYEEMLVEMVERIKEANKQSSLLDAEIRQHEGFTAQEKEKLLEPTPLMKAILANIPADIITRKG
jgi:integrase